MESLTFKDLAFPPTWYPTLGFEVKDDRHVIFGNVEYIVQGLKSRV